jgi:hypothetical protein
MPLIPTLFCPKPWEEMPGSEIRRFCTYCKKHVHNLENLSERERLALLSSPAGTICSRYRVAIRRPIKGKEESYHHHLLKYGAGVALSGAVLLVLWEWHGQEEKQRYYKVAGIKPSEQGMPRNYYEERQVITVGMPALDSPFEPKLEPQPPELDELSPRELKLDLSEVEKMIELAKPQFPQEKPVVPLKR